MKERTQKGILAVLPAVLMAGYVPLAMKAYIQEADFSRYDWASPGISRDVDLFLVLKSRLIVALGIWMAAALLIRFLSRKASQYKYSHREDIPLDLISL